jgi:hypothetical protein
MVVGGTGLGPTPASTPESCAEFHGLQPGQGACYAMKLSAAG